MKKTGGYEGQPSDSSYFKLCTLAFTLRRSRRLIVLAYGGGRLLKYEDMVLT